MPQELFDTGRLATSRRPVWVGIADMADLDRRTEAGIPRLRRRIRLVSGAPRPAPDSCAQARARPQSPEPIWHLRASIRAKNPGPTVKAVDPVFAKLDLVGMFISRDEWAQPVEI
jgi:hypothetical protein